MGQKRSLWKRLGIVVGGMAAYNWSVTRDIGIPDSALNGDAFYYPWQRHYVYYEVGGPVGAPAMLLLHGHNAGASTYEMRRIFPALQRDFRVYAVDLLGYGMSDRPAQRFTANLYVDLITDFVREVMLPEDGPVHAIASSLSSAHLILAAHKQPQLFHKLLLICPTGIASLTQSGGLAGEAVYWLLRTPVVGTFLFNLLVSSPSLRYFLQQSYADPDRVTDEMIADYFIVTHQPGARHAPACFISGQLNCDVKQPWQSLSVPAFVVWGKEARYTAVSQLQEFLHLRPETPYHVFENCGILPHDERADEFVTIAQEWFAPR